MPPRWKFRDGQVSAAAGTNLSETYHAAAAPANLSRERPVPERREWAAWALQLAPLDKFTTQLASFEPQKSRFFVEFSLKFERN